MLGILDETEVRGGKPRVCVTPDPVPERASLGSLREHPWGPHIHTPSSSCHQCNWEQHTLRDHAINMGIIYGIVEGICNIFRRDSLVS